MLFLPLFVLGTHCTVVSGALERSVDYTTIFNLSVLLKFYIVFYSYTRVLVHDISALGRGSIPQPSLQEAGLSHKGGHPLRGP